MKNKIISLKLTLVISLILFMNLTLLFYLKYSSHGLSLADFSFSKIGNLINLTFTVLTVIGFIIVYSKKINISISIIYSLLGILNLFLLLVVVINFINIPSSEYYVLNLSFTQVLVISAFGLFQFTQLFLMLLLWLRILKIDKLVFLRASVNSFFIALGLIVFTLIFINSARLSQKSTSTVINKSDVAVVLGAAVWSDNKPSPSLAFRVDKAAELLDEGLVSKIQLTGGNAPGELSEAEVSLNHILKKGINRNNIWIEKNTTSTIEQITFIKNDLLQKKNINSVTIVSDIYHLQRVKEICRFYNIKADIAASNLNLKTDKIIFYQLRECVALLLFWLFAL